MVSKEDILISNVMCEDNCGVLNANNLRVEFLYLNKEDVVELLNENGRFVVKSGFLFQELGSEKYQEILTALLAKLEIFLSHTV